jgi:hypothetical protein
LVVLRPVAALTVEMYTPERIQEFERETEVDENTRAAVRDAVRRVVGIPLDPR